ncbi:MAG: anaerobic ribonucleoside-triphosphate reductase activating protein [archaeon]
MEIVGFIPRSTEHWNNKTAATVFVSSCNYKCRDCVFDRDLIKGKKNRLIRMEKFFQVLEDNLESLDAVVITGGEATLQGRSLFFFIEELKEANLKVKLVTNGTQPAILFELIRNNLVDFVQLKIKTILNQKKYLKAVQKPPKLSEIKKSLRILKQSKIDYEITTTFNPELQSAKDLIVLGKQLGNIKKFVLEEPVITETNYYDALLRIAKRISLNSSIQEIRIKTSKGEESVQLKNSLNYLK